MLGMAFTQRKVMRLRGFVGFFLSSSSKALCLVSLFLDPIFKRGEGKKGGVEGGVKGWGRECVLFFLLTQSYARRFLNANLALNSRRASWLCGNREITKLYFMLTPFQFCIIDNFILLPLKKLDPT